MRTISVYPIYPSNQGLLVPIPVGAQLIDVSLSIHQYFLHALVDLAAPNGWQGRKIVAYLDDTPLPDGELGEYIGSAAQSGDMRRWHFFDLGVAGVPA